MNNIPFLRLNKNQDKRLKTGHAWIYSNEIDQSISPLSQFQSGEMVQVENHQGKPLGLAYINPHTLLCGRLLTHQSHQVFNQETITARIEQALQFRNQFFSQPFYRLVYGESDALPGLIIDRYGDYIVIQVNTAGMERFKHEVITALNQLLQPKGILWKNNSSARTLEGLPTYVEIASGTVPDEIELCENGARFIISPWKGQKTGWFYDHRDNRAWVQKFVSGKSVLDVFSYVGSFAIQAAIAGARSVHTIDSSAQATQWLRNNAKINKVEACIDSQISDAQPALKELVTQGKQFDIVLLDPPAFIKRRKDIKVGLRAYQRLNELAMRLVAKNGLLVTSSCSLHCSREMLLESILQSSVNLQRSAKVIAQGHQSLDHPIHPAILETNYLKTFFCYLS